MNIKEQKELIATIVWGGLGGFILRSELYEQFCPERKSAVQCFNTTKGFQERPTAVDCLSGPRAFYRKQEIFLTVCKE